MAYHEAGHAVVAHLLVERTYSLSRPPSVPCGSVDLDHAAFRRWERFPGRVAVL
jgi:hypothetical protein